MPKRLSRRNLHYSFSPSHLPVLKVEQDEVFEVETVDCFNGQVTPSDPSAEVSYEALNPVTGPIFVEGAEVGDILAVTLHDIQPEGIGISRFGCSYGQLSEHVQKSNNLAENTRFFDFDKESNMLTMRDLRNSSYNNRKERISFPASPMLGVIGVAPSGDESVSIPTMPAGAHGGNLDDRMNCKDSIIYLRVNKKGAFLSIGDMHAAMGDGEICGTGVECSGVATLSCRVLKKAETCANTENSGKLFENSNEPIIFPVTETKTHFHTHGVAVENIPKTTKVACEEAARLLVGQWDFTPEDSFVFLSVQGNLGCCQCCHPDKGTQIARMSIPKIAACPRPFRCLK